MPVNERGCQPVELKFLKMILQSNYFCDVLEKIRRFFSILSVISTSKPMKMAKTEFHYRSVPIIAQSMIIWYCALVSSNLTYFNFTFIVEIKMATRRGPRFKECRRLGVNVCGHPKAMNRANSPAFKRTHKISEYGQQLIEKQKVKAYYGILEKQLVRYFAAATKSTENTGAALIISLECRLDNLVYRIGFANSIRMARQIVNHGHILVDGKRITIPSYAVKVGQEISLCEKARKNEQFKACFLGTNKSKPVYIEKNEENFSGKLSALPVRADIPVEINDRMVVELFSK